MAWRQKPEVSAYEEGQWKAETYITNWQENYGDEATQKIQDAGQAAFDLLNNSPKVASDPEYQELLRGYLSKFD